MGDLDFVAVPRREELEDLLSEEKRLDRENFGESSFIWRKWLEGLDLLVGPFWGW